MIQIRFGKNFIYLETNKLIPSKELLENVKRSHKYHQIVTSIESLGIIEPIIVFYDKDKDVTKILDGHLRVEALKDLDIEKAPCILSSIDDAFTPNKQVNHINVVEEHRMIIKSLAKVSIEKLREGANKRGNSSRLTQSFHFFMFEPIFSPVNALNQPI